MNAITQTHPISGSLVQVRFINLRKEIPADVRWHNVAMLRKVSRILEKDAAPSPSLGEVSPTQARLESLRYLERLWDQCDTSFAAFDVEASDPLRRANDEKAFNCGIYPTAPRGSGSGAGSPAAMCAALGG